MKIQYLNGGLANQVFQYIFYRHAQLSTRQNEIWFLDDSFFFYKQQHNGYELERVFGLKPNLLSQQFDEVAWNHFIENRKKGIGTAQTIFSMGTPIEMIAEAANYKTDNPFSGNVHMIPCNGYYPEIIQFPGKVVYYFGYWINKNWLGAYKEEILSELKFDPITDEHNRNYSSLIQNSVSVGVHIRRGDFVNLGLNMDISYYKNASQKMIESHPELTFFVFSDDLAWCRKHVEELGLSLAKNVIFVEGNTKENSYIDLQLMSLCKGLIISNSSFSYLSALMNQNLEFYINPLSYREI